MISKPVSLSLVVLSHLLTFAEDDVFSQLNLRHVVHLSGTCLVSRLKSQVTRNLHIHKHSHFSYPYYPVDYLYLSISNHFLNGVWFYMIVHLFGAL